LQPIIQLKTRVKETFLEPTLKIHFEIFLFHLYIFIIYINITLISLSNVEENSEYFSIKANESYATDFLILSLFLVDYKKLIT